MDEITVLQSGLPQVAKELMLGGFHDLLGGEVDIVQVGVHLARQGLFQKGEQLVGLSLGHKGHRLIQLGNDLPFLIDVGASDAADGGFVRTESAAKLGYFFIVHGYVPRLLSLLDHGPDLQHGGLGLGVLYLS